MKYQIKYFIDFTVLVFLYAFVFFRKWRTQGRDKLLVNTLMYAYLSLVLYFTMMPVVASIPFMLDHPYKPMNLGIELLQPFFDRSSDVTDLITNVIGGALGYGLYAVFKPIAFWVLERLNAR